MLSMVMASLALSYYRGCRTYPMYSCCFSSSSLLFSISRLFVLLPLLSTFLLCFLLLC
jgi:hypothetical protein